MNRLPQPADLPFALDDALAAARYAAVHAARLLQQHFARVSDLHVRSKSEAVDLVSEADTEAEQVIHGMLDSFDSNIGFLGEEGSADSAGYAWQWVIDPLDGTSNFLAGLPLWAISIALTDSDLTPLVGIVAAPELARTWHAVRRGGCFCNGQPCRVRSIPPGAGLLNAMLATGFPYSVSDQDATNLNYFAAMQRHFHKIRRIGSAAIDLAFVAGGVFDGMWELKLHPWDTAAGMLLVEEAGGLVTRIAGNSYHPGDPDMLVAATPELMEEMRGILLRAANPGHEC